MELRTHWATLTNFKDFVHASYSDVADLSWHDQRVLGGIFNSSTARSDQ
jgi:hypothetical protein